MNKEKIQINSGVAYPQGFLALGVSAGIKKNKQALDLGALISSESCSCAAVFTQNRFCAPSVEYSRQIVKSGKMRGIIVNSGNANAGTGVQGVENVDIMVKVGERVFQLPPHSLAIAQTGIIGVQIDITKVIDGIIKLRNQPGDSSSFARAIMTTDTTIKEYANEIVATSGHYRIGGCAKGSGMIHPNLATMLAFVTTDAKVSPSFLKKIIGPATDVTFNSISVDRDTSTNDSVYLLANGKSGVEIKEGTKEGQQFVQAIQEAFGSLARQIILDGEGATKLMAVNVSGAKTLADARAAARAVASSSLVKTALHGGDPNWGRIMAAAGYSGAKIDMRVASLHINDICLYKNEMPFSQNLGMAALALKEKESTINLNLNLGKYQATAWGCDLSARYVAINSEYAT